MTFRPLAESFEAAAPRDEALAPLRPARIDVEASSLSLEARPDLKLKADVLRVEVADALDAQLAEASAGRAPQRARFRAKVTAAERTNVGMVLLAPLTLAFAGMLPYVNLSVRLELEVQVGEARYAAVGRADQDVTALGPKVVAEALQSALGLALADAAGKLAPSRPALAQLSADARAAPSITAGLEEKK